MTERVIDITRPLDDPSPFNFTITLSGQTYRFRFLPSIRGEGGGWYFSIDDVVGVCLRRSVRLVVGPKGTDIDLLANDRALQPTLPPGKLVMRGPRDPQLLDLADASFQLVYITEDGA